MIETIKLTKIYINDSKKDGTKFIDKNGNPYKKMTIQTDRHAGYLSDFIFRQDDPKLKWQVGDMVEIIVYQNGDFKNFKLPTQIDRLEARIEVLENIINDGKLAHDPKAKPNILGSDEEEIEIKVEDLPF